MATPRGARVNLRPDLSTFVEFALATQMGGFIGYQVLPIFNTRDAGGNFGRIPIDQLAKLADVGRNAQGGYNRFKWNFVEDSFRTKEYGLEGPVDRNNANTYANVVDAYRETTMLTTFKVLAKAEKRVADKIQDTGTFNSTAVAATWTNRSTSDPIEDVLGACERVRAKIGEWPNTVVMSQPTMINCQESDSVKDRLAQGSQRGTLPDEVMQQELARLFRVRRVLVGDAMYDATMDGQPTTTLTDFWDPDTVFVGKVNTSNLFSEVGVGRTFHWPGDGSRATGRAEQYYEPQVRGDVVRIRHQVDEQIIYDAAGELLTGANA